MTGHVCFVALSLAFLLLARSPLSPVHAVEFKFDILTQAIDLLNGLKDFVIDIDEFIVKYQEREGRNLKKEQAEALRKGLTNFSNIIQNMLYRGSRPALEGYRAYLAGPPPYKLEEFSKAVQYPLSQTEEAINFLQTNSGDLVLEPVYANLLQSLQQRLVIFNQLRGLEGDATTEQIEQMKQILNMWEEVNARLDTTIQNLNTYIKTLG
jgi:hypothetical protein